MKVNLIERRGLENTGRRSSTRKIKIFEKCGFSERDIQKFLLVDKLNYNTLEEIYNFSMNHEVFLRPRDVSLALRDVSKAKDCIKERAGILMGERKISR